MHAYRSGPPPTYVAVAARTHGGGKQRSNLDAYLISDFEGYLARDYATLCERVTARAAVAVAVLSGHFLDWSRNPSQADRAADLGFKITRAAGDVLAGAFTSGGPPITDVELRERLGQTMLSTGYGVHQAARDRRFIDTAASCTLAVLQRDRLEVIQAGDNRAYVLRDRRLALVSQGSPPGGLAPPNALRPPPLGVPTTALPPLYTYDLRLGDTVILCSRGVAASFDEGRLLGILLQSASLEAAAQAIVDDAIARRTEHNLTVVLASPLG